jgi:hypothetical protein
VSSQLSVGAALAGGLAISATLAVVHLLAPRIRRLPGVPEEATASFAGGLAVAYVFLHLLPELVEGNQALGEVLRHVIRESPLLDLAIFGVALAGFTLFYGLERRAQRTGADGTAESAAGGPALFRLHLGSFVVYNALITYTMPLRLRTGIAFAVLFSVAMGLHFVLTDRGLEEHYPRRFRRHGRPVLAGALLLGWILAAAFAPSNTVVVALLTAFLGGSILLNVFKEELPADRGSSFGWFCVGLLVYSALLTLVTGLSE